MHSRVRTRLDEAALSLSLSLVERRTSGGFPARNGTRNEGEAGAGATGLEGGRECVHKIWCETRGGRD